MIAIADDSFLYSLNFSDKKMPQGRTEPIDLLEAELALYFAGKLKEFKTPFFFLGTPFQKEVWGALQKIPYGQTRSYGEIAAAINKPTAFRAVALANKANPLGIIIPCHRVINADGKIGGYNGGVEKKEKLLHLERGER